MKILCAYSGIEFTCEHFPASLFSREACHPIFHLPQKRLISFLGKWGANELTPTDSYLLFLAVLRSSDLVDFRLPVIRTERTDSIVAQNMEALIKTTIRLNTVINPSVLFPHFVISADTRNLDNVQYWIQNWKDSYQDFIDGKGKDYDDRKLAHREAALERMIKNPYKSIQETARSVADWASSAGEFPTFQTVNRFTEQRCTLSDYWKQIIITAGNDDKIYSINRQDLEELLEHCESTISYGSIFSSALFKLLRHALEKQKNFLGLGNLGESFTILGQDNVQDANLRVIIDSAPTELPKKEDFPATPAGKFAYMKAKMQYDMLKKHISASVPSIKPTGNIVPITLKRSINDPGSY